MHAENLVTCVMLPLNPLSYNIMKLFTACSVLCDGRATFYPWVPNRLTRPCIWITFALWFKRLGLGEKNYLCFQNKANYRNKLKRFLIKGSFLRSVHIDRKIYGETHVVSYAVPPRPCYTVIMEKLCFIDLSLKTVLLYFSIYTAAEPPLCAGIIVALQVKKGVLGNCSRNLWLTVQFHNPIHRPSLVQGSLNRPTNGCWEKVAL